MRIITGFWLVAALALLAACQPAPQPETKPAAAPTPAPPAKTAAKTFVMVPKGVNPYYEPCYQGFEAAAAKYGVKAEHVEPREFQAPQQVEVLENLISRHVDGIAISAVDDQGLVEVVKRATDAGIKVICFDAPAPSTAALCYIGTANEEAGKVGAEALAKAMGDEGEVAVLQGGLAAPNLNDRYKGFEAWLKEHAPKIHIVAKEDTQGKADIVLNKCEALIEAHSDIKAIFSVSAEGVPGAASVLKDRGKAGKVVLAGFDDLPDTLAGIKAGTVSFCIAQRTYKMGWLSIEKLLDAVAGNPLPKQIDTGTVIVTKDNVDTYAQADRADLK
jgi:ribose transport system substrate-binding protein